MVNKTTVQLRQNTRVTALRLLGTAVAVFSMSACGGGGGSAQPQPPAVSSSVSNTGSSRASSSVAAGFVALQGHVTFDWVGPVPNRGKAYLDYSNVQAKPARGVTVQLLDSLNSVIETTSADDNGFYQFEVAANRAVKVRVKAGVAASNYAVQLKDNTRSGAEYVLDGSLVGSGTNGVQTRNLHAQLGWDAATSNYTGERQSAPFAVLDAIYGSVQMVTQANPNVLLPSLNVFWSTKNIANSGSFDDGNIGSSLYSTFGSAIYVLGSANNDTDEFDASVITHEFGHYLEDKLSRSESIGGIHYIGRPIDMRVAFGEGFGNAFAAMSTGSPNYLDTSGPAQQNGFVFSVEANNLGGGYYMEGAVHAVLYDIFDASNEAADTLSLGFAPILAALQHDDYLNFDGYTSIFPFISTLKKIMPENTAAINSLLLAQNINGVGPYGEGETATGSVPFSLPIYQRLAAGAAVSACSNNNLQEVNGLEVNRFILVEIPSRGTYTLEAKRRSGIQPSNPSFEMYRQGLWAGQSKQSTNDVEVWTRIFDTGVYALSVYEEANSDDDDKTGGLVCFDVSLTRI